MRKISALSAAVMGVVLAASATGANAAEQIDVAAALQAAQQAQAAAEAAQAAALKAQAAAEAAQGGLSTYQLIRYFPMQKVEKILPKMSSEVTLPVISPK